MNLNIHDYTNGIGEGHEEMIFEAVKEGMAPFRYKQIDLYMEYDIDYHEVLVAAGFVLMNGYTVSYSERVGARDLAGYPDREMHRVADAMRKAFRNREDFYDLASLIQLGEN